MNYKITLVISADSLEAAKDVASELRDYIEHEMIDDTIDLLSHTVEPE